MDAVKPVRARNRRGEGNRLREEIVDAAVALLDETGDERAVTLRSVARRAGIAAPSIYRHFPDQPAIMLAVTRAGLAELESALQAAADAAEGPEQRIWAVGRAYLGFAEQHPTRYRALFGGVWMPTLDDGGSVTADDLVGLGEGIFGLISQTLAEAVEAGISTCQDPAGDAVALWLGLHGLAHQRASTRVLPGPEDIDERMIRALARITRAAPPRR